MAAAWFIWRDMAAVDDQWKIVTGAWSPRFDPPRFILSDQRRQPGTLACVFQQAGFARGDRPYVRLQDIDDDAAEKTTDPYDRLRFALQSGKLRATIVQESQEGDLAEEDSYADEWLDFNSLADPANDAPFHVWNDPARYAILVSREGAVRAEAELSAAERAGAFWKLEQALGWIAYRRDLTFRSLGRIDLQPPTFFGRSYKSARFKSRPLEILTAKLLAGRVFAYVDGVVLTRPECISLLGYTDGPWGKKISPSCLTKFEQFGPASRRAPRGLQAEPKLGLSKI